MQIIIKAKPSSHEEKIEQIDETHYIVSVKEPPVRGAANYAIVMALQEHFHTKNIRIIAGHTSRNKVVEINSPQE